MSYTYILAFLHDLQNIYYLYITYMAMYVYIIYMNIQIHYIDSMYRNNFFIIYIFYVLNFAFVARSQHTSKNNQIKLNNLLKTKEQDQLSITECSKFPP